MSVWIALIILVSLTHVFFSYRRNQFRTIKRKYGTPMTDPSAQEELAEKLFAFNQAPSGTLDLTLGIRDSTLINIDGSSFPLVDGSLAYIGGGGDTLGHTVKDAVFLVVQGNGFAHLALKYRDIFEFGVKRKETSVFWVKDLKKLMAILTPTGGR